MNLQSMQQQIPSMLEKNPDPDSVLRKHAASLF